MALFMESLWPLIVGISGILEGPWGVLVPAFCCTWFEIGSEALGFLGGHTRFVGELRLFPLTLSTLGVKTCIST